ncbi:MAG: hypothetical protein NVSMB51_04530 [Solirubrobacteraceae bacterium]
MRAVIFIATLSFMLLLAGLTVTDIVKHGVSVLNVPSLLILLLFGFGVLGALRHPPDQ